MRSVIRASILLAVGLVISVPMSGCGDGANDKSMAGTTGTAAADAPKSQADFFKQQQQLSKQAKSKPTPKK